MSYTSMFSNVLFVLTIFNYIGLAILNIQKTNATGERLMGSGFIGLGLIAAYVLFSLLLTISITSKGGFNWLSSATLSRNFLVGILWFCMIAGVVFIESGQRRIPVQFAKRVVVRKVMGEQCSYILIKVDTAGVVHVIFAQSLVVFPALVAGMVNNKGISDFIQNNFINGQSWWYLVA